MMKKKIVNSEMEEKHRFPFVPRINEMASIVEKKQNIDIGKCFEYYRPKNTPDLYDPKYNGLFFLDLDDTLVCSEKFHERGQYQFTFEHKKKKYGLAFRACTLSFLNFCRFKLNLKLVVFTAGEKEYAMKMLGFLNFKFDHYLFRDSCVILRDYGLTNDYHTKDLSLFSSNMKRTLLFDNSNTNCIYNTANVIMCKNFSIYHHSNSPRTPTENELSIGDSVFEDALKQFNVNNESNDSVIEIDSEDNDDSSDMDDDIDEEVHGEYVNKKELGVYFSPLVVPEKYQKMDMVLKEIENQLKDCWSVPDVRLWIKKKYVEKIATINVYEWYFIKLEKIKLYLFEELDFGGGKNKKKIRRKKSEKENLEKSVVLKIVKEMEEKYILPYTKGWNEKQLKLLSIRKKDEDVEMKESKK